MLTWIAVGLLWAAVYVGGPIVSDHAMCSSRIFSDARCEGNWADLLWWVLLLGYVLAKVATPVLAVGCAVDVLVSWWHARR